MAWGSTVTSDTLTLTTSLASIQASASEMVVNLSPRELCQVQLEVDSNGTTDDVDWEIQSSPDDGTTWDSLPILSGRIDVTSSTVNQVLTVLISGVEQFRVQGKKTGSTDTITLKVRYRKDGVSA
jgi:hypothetical protein